MTLIHLALGTTEDDMRPTADVLQSVADDRRWITLRLGLDTTISLGGFDHACLEQALAIAAVLNEAAKELEGLLGPKPAEDPAPPDVLADTDIPF